MGSLAITQVTCRMPEWGHYVAFGNGSCSTLDPGNPLTILGVSATVGEGGATRA
jgi:hypothetical protein